MTADVTIHITIRSNGATVPQITVDADPSMPKPLEELQRTAKVSTGADAAPEPLPLHRLGEPSTPQSGESEGEFYLGRPG